MKELGRIADLIVALEREEAVVRGQREVLWESRQREDETLADCIRRGGLVRAMPRISVEQRRPDVAPAYRLVFPQRDGVRERVYLGTEGEFEATRCVAVRREFEGLDARARLLHRVLRDIGWRLERIRRYLEEVHGDRMSLVDTERSTSDGE